MPNKKETWLDKAKGKIKPFIHPIRWIKEEPRIRLNEILPDQPGAELSKVSILQSIHLFIDNNKKPIGNAISTTGEMAGGPLGFALRVAGKLVTGNEKLKEKTYIDWAEVVNTVINFIKSILSKKK